MATKHDLLRLWDAAALAVLPHVAAACPNNTEHFIAQRASGIASHLVDERLIIGSALSKELARRARGEVVALPTTPASPEPA